MEEEPSKLSELFINDSKIKTMVLSLIQNILYLSFLGSLLNHQGLLY